MVRLKRKGVTIRQDTIPKKSYVTINRDGYDIVETFFEVGKSGNEVGSLCEALARVVSISLQEGVEPKKLYEQLIGIRGGVPFIVRNKEGKELFDEGLYSYPDAFGKAIREEHLRLEKLKKRKEK